MRRRVALSVCVLALLGVHPVAAQAGPALSASSAGAFADEGYAFVPLSPSRVLDTRDGTGGAAGPVQGRITLDLTTTVPATATAVVLNLTGVAPTAATHIRVSPDEYNVPSASILNLVPGETRANQITVLLGPDRRLHLHNNAGAVHLLADLAGYYTPDPASRFTAVPATRVLDTRTSTALGPGATREVDLSAHVPATATAVTFTLTGTGPTASTHVTAHPSGAARPVVSNLNLEPGQTSPNLVTVALGADRRVRLYNHAGSTHLLADLAGYYATDRGHRFYPVTPARVDDSRIIHDPYLAGWTRDFTLDSWMPATAVAAVVNLTGTNVTAPTYVVAYPAETTRPSTSNLNLPPGRDTSNGAVLALGRGARMTLYNHAGSTDLILDLTGFFATAPGCVADCLHAWGGDPGHGSPTPSRRPWLSGVTSVAAGRGTAYAVTSDGTLWAWGENRSGQLGTGTRGGSSAVPLQVGGGMSGMVAVAAGEQTGHALQSDGSVWTWGWDQQGRVARVLVPSKATAIAASDSTTFALVADGTVWAWGSDGFGNLGGGACPTANCPPATPVRVPLPLPGDTRITAIEAGAQTAFALRSDGTVWAWGRNWRGESGTGAAPSDRVSPSQVVGLTDVVTIGGGDLVGYAVTADGRVWSWGDDTWGTLGTGATCAGPTAVCWSTVPVQVTGLTGPTTIDSAYGTTVARTPDGAVWAWGRNGDNGRLGTGVTGSCATTPLPVDCRSSVPVRTLVTGASDVAVGALGAFAVVPG